jgi:hypothetical protein
MRQLSEKLLRDLSIAAHNTSHVAGLTHTFYKYPARLSPILVRAAIEAFTQPGDWILDPFVGGGTTLVEAQALGRSGIGVDNNELAIFISRVKTTLLSTRLLNEAERIVEEIIEKSNLCHQYPRPSEWIENGYQRNLNIRTVWRIRKQIEQYLISLNKIKNRRLQNYLRCALLRTAQWALDNRKLSPPILEFRQRFLEVVTDMANGMRDLSSCQHNIMEESMLNEPPTTYVIHGQAEKIKTNFTIKQFPHPKLVITSPPYPGVHVIYHRWQIHGRKETPAPFWIANCHDGYGESHYSFGWRCTEGLSNYFKNLESAFRSIVTCLNDETVVVQVIAFSEPSWQLPRYLEVMNRVGLKFEVMKKIFHRVSGVGGRAVLRRRGYRNNRRIRERCYAVDATRWFLRNHSTVSAIVSIRRRGL